MSSSRKNLQTRKNRRKRLIHWIYKNIDLLARNWFIKHGLRSIEENIAKNERRERKKTLDSIA